MFLPILEEAGIYVKTGFTPLDVEIKWKRDAEVTVVDFKDIGNVNFNSLKKEEDQYFCQVGIQYSLEKHRIRWICNLPIWFGSSVKGMSMLE